MTDNDVIKALEWCANHSCCDGCPFVRDGMCVNTNTSVYYKAVLDIINRQKAEIWKLKDNAKPVRGTVQKSRDYNEERERILHARSLKKARAEVVKEYTERLKKKINELVKEMK